MQSAIICLNPSLCTAPLSSACKQRGVSLPTAAARGFKNSCSQAGLWRLQRRLSAGKCRCVGRFGYLSAFQLLQHRAAFCACAVRTLSSEGGTQWGVFLESHTHMHAHTSLHVAYTRLLSPLDVWKQQGERVLFPCFSDAAAGEQFPAGGLSLLWASVTSSHWTAPPSPCTFGVTLSPHALLHSIYCRITFHIICFGDRDYCEVKRLHVSSGQQGGFIHLSWCWRTAHCSKGIHVATVQTRLQQLSQAWLNQHFTLRK